MLKANNIRQIDNHDAEDAGDAGYSSSALRIKIGVVENDILLREGLMALLNTVEEFECVGAWNRAQEAVTDLQQLRPDVLLLDVGYVEKPGLAPLKNLSSLSPAPRIFLTMKGAEDCWASLTGQPLPPQSGAPVLFSDLQFKMWAVVSEARGFRSIAESIRNAYFGEDGMDPAAVTRLAEPYLRSLLDTTTEKVPVDSLTLRECQVIQLIAQGHSNKDIAREMTLGYSTIKNYVSSILRKLELDGRTQIALLAHQRHGDLVLPFSAARDAAGLFS